MTSARLAAGCVQVSHRVPQKGHLLGDRSDSCCELSDRVLVSNSNAGGPARSEVSGVRDDAEGAVAAAGVLLDHERVFGLGIHVCHPDCR